jgi:predicted ATPase
MLVAGFSGIGKTAVVNEVHKPIVRQCGISSKANSTNSIATFRFSAFVKHFET